MPNCSPGGDGLTNCGAAGESCCTSLPVTGGTFDRTYWYSDIIDGGSTRDPKTGQLGPNVELIPTDAGRRDPATVSNFRLDKYEVTVGRFQQFVEAWNCGAGWLPPPGSGKHAHLNGGQGLVNSGDDAGVSYETGWLASYDAYLAPAAYHLGDVWTGPPTGDERLPTDSANWYEAYAFCIWDGGFLPSEAEWEYAAAGGDQQRIYPWGSTFPGFDSQYAIYGSYYGDAGYMAPVGSATLGAGLWGQLDLAGNAPEWTLDWMYGSHTYFSPCVDCAYLTMPTGQTKIRVNKGGGFYDGEIGIFTGMQGANDPTLGGVGFRCARAP